MDGFDKLHRNIVSSAARTLDQMAPERIKDFREAVARGNFAESMNALADLRVGGKFSRWRDICIALIDVRMQMHRVRTGLLLLSNPAPAYISQGEWVLYQQDAWWIWTQGLLDRFEKLTTKVVRKLIEPTNRDQRRIRIEMLQAIGDLKARVKKARNAVAHGDGAVEELRKNQGVERYVLTGGKVDVQDWLKPMASYQRRWHYMLSGVSNHIFDEIDGLSERLSQDIKWNSLR